MSPTAIASYWKNGGGVWLTHYCNVISIYVFSFWGLRSQTPTRVGPFGPVGGLLSPVPRVCPPPKPISGYASVIIGVGDGGQGSTCPLKSGKYFSGNYYLKFGHFSGKNHVKFGNFVIISSKYHTNSGILVFFFGQESCKIRAFC